MAETLQIRLCGYGGQGIVLAGTILGHAATRDGKWAAGSSSYGAAARGGTCRADVVISDASVVYPLVVEPDILVAMSQRAYDEHLRPGSAGVVFYDDRLVCPRHVHGWEQIGVPATHLAIAELDNRQVATMIMLAALARRTGVVTQGALVAAIAAVLDERFRAVNAEAIEVGFQTPCHADT